MIKLNNYFFEVDDIDFKLIEVGSENESWNGINNSNYVARYLEIELSFSNLTPTEHGHLLYLLNLNRDNSTPNESLVFSNLKDDEYLNGEDIVVDVPLNSFNFERNKGEESYDGNITLRELGTRTDVRR